MVRQFIEQLLESHNGIRQLYQAQPLTLSSELTHLAQKKADELAENDISEHDLNNDAAGPGENLFATRTIDGYSEITGEVVTQRWHREVEHYKWSRSNDRILCRNFIQLVWQSTMEVGFGQAVSNSGCLYVVGRYKPPAGISDGGGLHSNVSMPMDMDLLGDSNDTHLDNKFSFNPAEEWINTLNSNMSTRRFAKQMLVGHNEYRAMHQAPPLRMNDELTRLAQNWADTLATRDALAYDLRCDRQGIGENVARKCDARNSDFYAQEFVDSWYSEVTNFNWRSLDDQFDCSHFAQMVWRGTREVGFGRAVSMSGCVYVVGRYLPRGNNSGEFPRNVLPRMMKRSNDGPDPINVAKQEPNVAKQQEATNDSKPFTKLISNLLPPKKFQMESAVPLPSSVPKLGPRMSIAPTANSRSTIIWPQDTPVRVSETPPTSSKPLLDALTKQSPNASPFAAAESPPSASPMSAKSLFGALASKDKTAAPAATPLSSKGLFVTLATKRDSSPGTPSTGNILSRTLSLPARDQRFEPDEELVPTFNMSKFVKQLLVSHNEYRAEHRAPPMRLNSELARLAQDWADVLAMRDRMAHDPNCAMVNAGENVAMKFKIGETNFTGDVFTDLWYDEIEAYDWHSEEPQPDCRHFTQLVWKSTTEVGFGRAVSGTGRVYVVGRYRPPGNYRGGYKTNVLPSEDDQAPAQTSQPPPSSSPSSLSPLFGVRNFGAGPVSKGRTNVTFSVAGETSQRTPAAGANTRALQDFLPLKSAMKPSSFVADAKSSKAGSAAPSPLSAMLLQRTLQTKAARVVEKKAEADDHQFSQRKFEGQMLVAHNEYRALHRSPPLRLNSELSQLAQQWAEVLSTKDKMAHDPQCGSLGLGENVAMKFRKGFTTFPGDIFTELWYNEIEQYRWTGEEQLACGHFTQLVWRSSTEVGFGRAVSTSGRVYVVGRYKPPGNYNGQFGRNVLPPTRVMPRSHNNPEVKETKEESKAKAANSRKTVAAAEAAEATAATAAEPVEYPGFGTARVVDYKLTPAMTNRRLVVTAAAAQQQQVRQTPTASEEAQKELQKRRSTLRDS